MFFIRLILKNNECVMILVYLLVIHRQVSIKLIIPLAILM